MSDSVQGGPVSLEVINLKLLTLTQQGARLEGRLEGLEVKMDQRLDKLQFVDKGVYVSDKEHFNEKLDTHFALIMTTMSLLITLILAFIGYLVVAA